MEMIVFMFEERRYQVDMGDHDLDDGDMIALPDGRIISVGYWLRTEPPLPMDITLEKNGLAIGGLVPTAEEIT